MLRTPRRFALSIVLLLCAAGAECAAGPAIGTENRDPHAATRQVFMDAMAAVNAMPVQAPEGDSPALRDYPLYPYLQAARLRRQLQLTGAEAGELNDTRLPIDADIARFLERHGDQPAGRALRQQWLESLASRRAWTTFSDHFSKDRDVAPSLQCHALHARVARGQPEGVAEEFTTIWLTPKSLPEACDPLLDWWKTRGGPGETLTVRRARLALEGGNAGLARFLAKSLPAASAAPLLQWADLIEQPSREIVALIAQPDRKVEDQALQDGWMRYARSDAEAAATTFPALVEARRLDQRRASPLALSVALGLAWSRKPGALEFFARVHEDDFDERAHEWHVRAALWARDWGRAASALKAMPEALRSQSRWKYWAARSSEQLGDFAAARAGYAAVIPTDNWYAVLASARLDRKFTPTLEPMALSDVDIARLAVEPGFVRARELLQCGMEPEASVEWRTVYDELPATKQMQAIGLASRWGWHHQAIATAARQKLFNDYDLLYPRPFDLQVAEASKRTGLSQELLYAIIRQESLYRADAGSSAGAVGLMQLLPETARLTARRHGVPAPSRAQLTIPSLNIQLGSHFLADLVERFEGETALASAGYNAGPNAARRWLPEAPLDLDVWAENIPYNETRAYVQRVAWHALVFKWLVDREPREVSSWLRSVRPAKEAASTATAGGS